MGWLELLAIALSTFVSEDLACIGAGLLVAAGELSFAQAVGACFCGIFVGDLLIYSMGRYLGRPVVNHRWLGRVFTPERLDRAERQFRRHGIWIILLTRFIPGTRTATYFSAGTLKAPALTFTLTFALAALLWTPVLVGLSSIVGAQLLEFYGIYEAFAIPMLLLAGLLLYLFFHYGIPLFSWRGRRRLQGKWMRASHWEFWPWWQVNWIVFLYAFFHGLFRYGRPALCTAVNPSMPHGGFIGERKSAILSQVRLGDEVIPRWGLVEAIEPEARWKAFKGIMETHSLDWPIVLKPDMGQRGQGVLVARSPDAAEKWIRAMKRPFLVQAFAPGEEFGIFYIRYPDAARGELFSLARKEQLHVEGNGSDDLATLIYRHPRAVAQLDLFLERFRSELERVPAEGECIRLGELGTHALGSLFRDGSDLRTEALLERVEAIAQSYPGFYFGRLDVKAPDEASLRAGIGLQVMEINGLSSEAAHIYSPGNGLFRALATLFLQWRTAYAIADKVVASGEGEASRPLEFLRDSFWAWWRQAG
jgi:membrane protein DedA with SNARE-associated domain